MTGPWVRCYQSRPQARLRLFCFPHAGGTASAYRLWPPLLPAGVEMLAVQYPGREERFSEPALTTMDELVTQLVAGLRAELDRPFVFFGHSMGASVAYETALALRAAGLPMPQRVVVSGKEAPEHAVPGEVHLRDDEGLVRELTALGGTGSAVLEHPELRELLLPIVRADYRLIETYQPTAADALECPVTAFVGDSDPELTVDQARDWDKTTSGGFDLQVFPGDHFYLMDGRAQVVAALNRRLPLAPSRPTAP
ncbi:MULTISPECIES: thioesterase II family protein [unclassified Crossiella]|uniref:thioesterase II family protein n=1 Tax=unclassified Crossiella TaxID=2620835 RepID=UPI001FFE5B9F|nr:MULTISPECIES: alpha/beta fold hydrolase [unclassified Crossiella]MCK2240470.1 alpha/beta fold hydrolase [Crossiella sp. S99.2]MCK2253079.1 alpha/beta fold hydrolase [Crossiella sp. S99.1]